MSSTSKLIALDYDKTYDADYGFWDEFVRMCKVWRYDVILLTYRDERYDWTELMDHIKDGMGVPVYCTRGVAKKWWWEQFGDGRKVDWWIDDNPLAILENSKADREWLEEWRKDGGHLNCDRTEIEYAKAS